ncbi:histone methylation protein, putative [Phytophthora infestans T30-4]|uniref:Histone methylation protein, putative n=1 Tax=Phytophthora infestans (strain T30-4) TaxID=403677 RepID=D0P1P2_PHYIT|nr:histone methylation protein, putative [Phytophthora infestans T30-4]EEY54676.1 histone methylation protein, putative [Phytophthora infestans T30-4]|eukprot:XP_002895770.1 histone methylation protein, putative [Phytophthora infestans T30-4]
MRTNFTDAQDKLEWKEVARAIRSKHSVQALENRLHALKRTYGRDLSRFPPCFFSTSTPTLSHKQHFRLLEPSQAESAIRDIFSSVSAADVRQQAGKTVENAGEMLPAASSVIQMIGAVHRDDVFLDIGAGPGNVAAQFAIQTIARQCLGIEKRPECLSQGDALDTPLSSRLPFQRASIVFLNDFLFDELAKLAVQEQLYMMPRVRLIVSTSRYCPRHRDSCRRRFCSKWRLAKITYGRGSWKSPPIPIYMYTTVQRLEIIVR